MFSPSGSDSPQLTLGPDSKAELHVHGFTDAEEQMSLKTPSGGFRTVRRAMLENMAHKRAEDVEFEFPERDENVTCNCARPLQEDRHFD